MARKINNFRFKQFEVIQQQSAMKVGTDGVLLGAWVEVEGVSSVLDIGTGTGLIALMLAQRTTDAQIDAVELDKGACEEANLNFENSPWRIRLTAIQDSIIKYAIETDKTYELIVCNPPFFTNGVRAPKSERSQARHTDTLSFEALIHSAVKLLAKNGTFAVVIPTDQQDDFIAIAKKEKLFLRKQTTIFPNEIRPPKRVLLAFTKGEMGIEEVECSTLQIEQNERHCFTVAYKELTKEFYLKF